MNIAIFLRIPILKKICKQLLLSVSMCDYLSENTLGRDFAQILIYAICSKGNHFYDFNCLILFKAIKIQALDFCSISY